MLQRSGSFFSLIPPVTKNLIIINTLIWLVMILFPGLGNKFVDYGGLHYVEASDFNIAQIITYMFIHSTQSIAHLFFNMFTLFMFGITLERVLGGKRFLFYYISCGIGAAIIQEATWALTFSSFVDKNIEMSIANWAYANNLDMATAKSYVSASQIASLRQSIGNALVTVGASGAIYGILLAFGMIFPNRPLYLMFIPVPIKAKWMVIGYGVIELILGLSSARDGVAHFAHLGGMIFGYLILLYWKKKGIIGNNGYY
jgi:membrane associated rhomboid family serine protease